MRMRPDGQVLQRAAREHLVAALSEPETLAALAPGELDLTLRVLRRARLLGRIAARLQGLGLLERQPRVVADQLESALVDAESRRRSGLWELDRIAHALVDLPEVPIVAMKGCAYLLANTPNAAGRSFADVDLLIPEAHLPEVEARLGSLGWRTAELTAYDARYYRQWTHELPPMTHVEREVEVDLHHSILMRTARLKPSSALLFAAARPVAGSRFRVLAPVDMVLHAIVHLFHGGEMDDALRELADIASLLRHFGEVEPGFWEAFWPRTVQLDLTRPAFHGLRYAHRLLAAPVPEGVLAVSSAGAPPRAVVRLMDALVPLALFPQHPDVRSRRAALARLALYVRSHWVKMPPFMLMRHLSYKFYVRRVGVFKAAVPSE